MKKYITLLALLAMLPFSAEAATTFYTVDLSPKKTLAPWTNPNGIKASDVGKYDMVDGISSWRGTWQTIDLANQVVFNSPNAGDILLSVGNAASTGSGGNFAAVKFELPTGAESATLSFELPSHQSGAPPSTAALSPIFTGSRVMEKAPLSEHGPLQTQTPQCRIMATRSTLTSRLICQGTTTHPTVLFSMPKKRPQAVVWDSFYPTSRLTGI